MSTLLGSKLNQKIGQNDIEQEPTRKGYGQGVLDLGAAFSEGCNMDAARVAVAKTNTTAAALK